MNIDAVTLSPSEAYKLMSGIVVPRPIAWVTSVSQAGVVNLAPFSAFTFVSDDPPMVAINISRGPRGLKDTARNVRCSNEFVVNIAHESMFENVHASGVDHPPEISEAEVLEMHLAACRIVKTPRLRDAPASLECVFHQAIAIGNGGDELVIGEVVSFYVRDEIVVNGKVDSSLMRPLCRIGGPTYAGLGTIHPMKVNH